MSQISEECEKDTFQTFFKDKLHISHMERQSVKQQQIPLHDVFFAIPSFRSNLHVIGVENVKIICFKYVNIIVQ